MPHGRRRDAGEGIPKGLWWSAERECWIYDFRCRGHRFRGELRGASLAEAKRELTKRRAAALLAPAAGKAAPDITFGQAASEWFLAAGGRRARPEEVERDLAWLQTKLGLAIPVSAIDDAAVARLIAHRRADGVSDSTINRTVTEHLRAVLRRAERIHGARAKVEWSAHRLKEPEPRPREASADEEARLIAAHRPDYRPAFRFMFLSGLRLEELAGMCKAHVHLGREPRLYLEGKGGRVAWIPLSRAMLAILQQEMTAHGLDCIWTYERRDGKGRAPITYEGLKTQHRRARKRAGLPSTRADKVAGFRLHDIRHTALHRVARASTNGLLMARRLGRHKDVKTTLRYVDATDAELRAALEAVQPPAETSRKTSHKTGGGKE